MTLKIGLAPGECVIIGKARVENGGERRCTLIITGEEIILRGRRVLREKDAVTPMTRLYFVVQCMYLSEDKAQLNELFVQVAREVTAAWPDTVLAIAEIGDNVFAGKLYDALNKMHELVEAEHKLLEHGERRSDP